MTTFGYTLSSEEHGPADLVDHAVAAEEAGFAFASVSDHFHPWVTAQGHSPFVWSVLGAVAQATERIELGVGVTCPIVRMHPALVAQAAATVSLLSDGRFTLGVGTGEALNEHIVGGRWPPAPVRIDMLAEAVEIIRALWGGDTVDRRGGHFEVENARIFDPPTEPIPVVVSAFGPAAATVAGRIGDGLWSTAPDREVVDTFAEAGGTGPRHAQLTVCWAEDAADARATVHRQWPNAAIPGQLAQDLSTPAHFEQAAQNVDEATATEHVPCGPDPAPFLDAVATYRDAGFDHLYFHQVGPDQAGFLRFWEQELRPALADGDDGSPPSPLAAEEAEDPAAVPVASV